MRFSIAQLTTVTSLLLGSGVILSGAQARAGQRIGRTELIDDVRQLADMIEAVHPDPYINGGGKIAFHKRLQDTIGTIPDKGMTAEEFYRHLRPFVAAIGDAHTWLRDPYETDYRRPGGIPLFFDIVEDTLYVAAAPQEHRALVGARLASVEGVPHQELVARQARAMGAENEYLLLRNLAGDGVLWKRCFFEHLVPEWKDKGKIRVALRHPDGRVREHVLDIPKSMKYPLSAPDSKIELPSRKKCDFVYEFMDQERKTALLVIDDMTGFREVFEYERAEGMSFNIDHARRLYKRYHGAWLAPSDGEKLIAGVPSATETFRSLVEEMKKAGTERLLVDLRRNDGGSSAMYDFLVYMLHGKEKLLSLKQRRTEIRKLSHYYFRNHKNVNLEAINRSKPFALKANDYDLGADYYGHFQEAHDLQGKRESEFDSFAAKMPSFEALYKAGQHDGYYCPRHVVVLCSPNTFSSGWTLMYYLHQAGAIIVGTPSSQGPNCFGNILGFELMNSGVRGIVSQKRFEYFPGDPERGRVLKPDYMLTYERLASYDFDPNAEILYALEVLDGLDRQENRHREESSGP